MNKQFLAFIEPARSTQRSRETARYAIWRAINESANDGVADSEAASRKEKHFVAEENAENYLSFSPRDAHNLVKRGIPTQALDPLADFLGLKKGLIVEYLDLDRSTASRRAAKNQPLPMHSAEGVIRLLELEQAASKTFETEEESADWLRRSHPMLDGETPLEASKTSYGTQRVKDILVAIKYGGVL